MSEDESLRIWLSGTVSVKVGVMICMFVPRGKDNCECQCNLVHSFVIVWQKEFMFLKDI